MARVRSSPRIRSCIHSRRTLNSKATVILVAIAIYLQRQSRSRAMRLFLDEVLYRPTGVRVDGMEYGRGSEWVKAMREGHWERIQTSLAYIRSNSRPSKLPEVNTFASAVVVCTGLVAFATNATRPVHTTTAGKLLSRR